MSDKQDKKDEDVTFDMYHFFSRKDVIALVIMMAFLLAIILFKAFFSPEVI
jgi:quinol-cytochrome oxidoreductase complex cytochrome b subunit